MHLLAIERMRRSKHKNACLRCQCFCAHNSGSATTLNISYVLYVKQKQMTNGAAITKHLFMVHVPKVGYIKGKKNSQCNAGRCYSPSQPV